MPQCPSANLLGVVQHLASPLAAPQEDFGASCATVREAQERSGKSRAGCSWLWLVLIGACDVHLRFSSPHPTSNLHPTPPHHAHKTFLNGSRRPAVNLHCQCQLQLLVFSSRYNSPPVASILSPGERETPQIDSSHLSFVPRSEAGDKSGQVRPCQGTGERHLPALA
jgi:hypothetical protein